MDPQTPPRLKRAFREDTPPRASFEARSALDAPRAKRPQEQLESPPKRFAITIKMALTPHFAYEMLASDAVLTKGACHCGHRRPFDECCGLLEKRST
jgi:hypothetical protein